MFRQVHVNSIHESILIQDDRVNFIVMEDWILEVLLKEEQRIEW
jgi:hypothetical protein